MLWRAVTGMGAFWKWLAGTGTNIQVIQRHCYFFYKKCLRKMSHIESKEYDGAGERHKEIAL